MRSHLEDDLEWVPRHQGKTRSLITISRDGFIQTIIHSGTPEAAKLAAVLSVGKVEHDTSKHALDNFIEHHYSHYAERVLQAFNYNLARAAGACALEMRKGFWLDQAGHPLGKRIVSHWASLEPYAVVVALLRDADNWLTCHPEIGPSLWQFVYSCILEASPTDSTEWVCDLSEASGLLATSLANKLIETENHIAVAEFFAREGLSQREKGGVMGWELASSKSVVGAVLLQQNKLGEAGPFVADAAKELLSLRDTVPEAARPRVVEAVDRAKSLYEKTGNQAQATYWSAELEDLKKDPRYALLE